MMLKLRWPAAVGTALGVVVLAAGQSSPGVTLRPTAGLPQEVLQADPTTELIAPELDGTYRVPPEVTMEERLERAPLRGVPPPARVAPSPRRLLRGRAEVAAMLQVEQSAPQAAADIGARPATWRSLGPDNLGGRTHALQIDPSNPDVMYAGGIGGGVWKSGDGGESWRPLNDTFSNISISALALDPDNPQTIYAATGDLVDRFIRIGARGGGIMKTTDGGANWQFIQGTQNDDFSFVSSLQISPNDSRRMYAATGSGFWISTDGAESWRKTKSSNDRYGCTDFAIRSDKSPEHILLSCGILATPGEGIFLSRDGGANWESVLNNHGGKVFGRSGLGIAASRQDVMYAAAADGRGLGIGLFRSDQGGVPGSWNLVNASNSTPGNPPLFGWCDDPNFSAQQGQGYYDNIVAVDPTNPDRVWVGGIDTFRSDDGGRTLRPQSYWWVDQVMGFSGDYDGTQFVHADQHAVLFHPNYDGQSNTTMFWGNDGGIFKTTNATAPLNNDNCAPGGPLNDVVFSDLNNQYVTSLFREGAVADEGRVFLGGLQDNGTWLETDVSKPVNPWVAIGGGDGAYVAVDPTGQTLIWSSQFGSFKRSIDGGRTALPGNAGITEQGDFITPLTIDPNDPRVFWAGFDSMWRTGNGGQSWQQASHDFPGDKINNVSIAPGNPNLIYATTFDGQLWKTESARATPPTWVQVATGSVSPGEITEVAIDPADNNIVYVTVASPDAPKVFKSTNGGGTWASIDGAAPNGIPRNTGAHSFAINPTNTSMVYVGTDHGVFESLDGGATWRVANENLATTTVEDLDFVANSSELYAFTYGRGVYRVDVGSQAPPPNDNIEAATEVVLNPDFRDRANTRLATGADTDPPLSCGAGGGAQAKSVWYRFTPADGGSYEISTEDTNFDTVVGIFTGAGGELSPKACDDNGVGEGGTSKLTLDASPGTSYYIEVARSSDAPQEGLAGALRFSVTRK